MQIKFWLSALLLSVAGLASAATPAQYDTPIQQQAAQKRAAAPAAKEGEHYKLINATGKADKPQVVEFFSYTCPACYKMETFLGQWKQEKPSNVSFQRMHVVGMFGPTGDLYAKAFYTGEVLGLTEKTHKAFFDMVHLERKPPRDENEIAAFYAKFGVKAETVLSTMKSFAVNLKMGQAKQAMEKYRLRGVPGFIINDRYFTDGASAGNFDMLDKVLSELPLR